MGNSAGGQSNIGNGLVSSLGAIGQGMEGMQLTEAGTQVAVQGAQMSAALSLQGGQYQADVYHSYESSVLSQTNYDTALVQTQLNRQMDALGRQVSEVSSKNLATEGASGLSPGSKSYLAVSSRYLSNTERQLVQMRNTAQTQQNELLYQGNLQITQLENQANSALYQGQVGAAEAQYQAEVAQYEGDLKESQQQQGMISSVIGAIF